MHLRRSRRAIVAAALAVVGLPSAAACTETLPLIDREAANAEAGSQRDGSTDVTPDAGSDGGPDAANDGAADGSRDGAIDSSGDGAADGSSDGAIDGSSDGGQTDPPAALCLPDTGWCWQNPVPFGTTMIALWGFGADDLWLVGMDGVVVRHDGSGWYALPSPTDALLTSIWGTSAQDVWVAAREAPLMHWNGTGWTDSSLGLPPSWTDPRLWGSAADDVWVQFGEDVLRWDGSMWQTMYPIQNELVTTGWSLASNDVWIAGEDFQHWDGTQWTPVSNPVPAAIEGMWGGAPDDLWAVTMNGHTLHWDGVSWTPMTNDTSGEYRDVHGTSTDDVWMPAGFSRKMVHWDGTALKAYDVPADVAGVWAASPTCAYAFGDYQVVRWDGASWTPLSTNVARPIWNEVRANVSSIWAVSPSDVWAVTAEDPPADAGPEVLHYDGVAWASVPLPVGGSPVDGLTLNDVWAASGTDVWVVGAGIFPPPFVNALHWDGVEWSAVDAFDADQLTAVTGTTTDDVWVAGSSAGTLVMYHWDGADWTEVPSGSSGVVRRMMARASDDVWAAGDAGLMLHWDGTQWLMTPTGTSEDFSGVWASSAGDAWAVTGRAEWSEFGSIHRWNGSGWACVLGSCGGAGSALPNLRGVWGRSPDEVWVVGGGQASGYEGVVYAWDGATWADLSPRGALPLHSVGGTPQGDLWVGGLNAQILRRAD